MTVVIWTLPDCSRCDALKKALHAVGTSFSERKLSRLMSGEDCHLDAMVSYAWNDLAPLMMVDDVFLDLDAIDAIIGGGECTNSHCRIRPV